MARPRQTGWVFLLIMCCLPGNDLRQEFQDVGGQSAQVFGQAHEARGQGDGLPMQQHLVGSADGGTHPRVGQPKACFGNLLHSFLQTTHIIAISVAILHVLTAALTPVLASPNPVLATFFTHSYKTAQSSCNQHWFFHTCWLCWSIT